jgi:hypothetical protein
MCSIYNLFDMPPPAGKRGRDDASVRIPGKLFIGLNTQYSFFEQRIKCDRMRRRIARA